MVGDDDDLGGAIEPFRVLAAVAAGEPIYICEGEKDVLTAESAGLTATTNAGGALAWTGEHAKWL
ncbi:toprim domain-containing protein, partial [Nocardia sp. 852002-20019_SCH5090214]|uniref:toprim domain-containing protein n=1 Tax=Nocardia sp. 852002-20019_SCH5090214 TaxID=1834087 RepID=UPI001E4421F0